MAQNDLFEELTLAGPGGLRHESNFLSFDEEAAWIDRLAALPFAPARYKGYTAQRHVVSYGSRYDFDALHLGPAEPLPDLLLPLRDRAAAWADIPPTSISDALVARYEPGTPLGWHRDVPEFEQVIGVSFMGAARMRFRPYPPLQPKKADVWSLDLAPRSIYLLSGDARWGWQHSVAPTPRLRYSVTFRTRKNGTRR
jgi:alkylated DNA repair dioxygenase AlkB